MLTQQSPGRYRVAADLTFGTVTALRPQGLAALAQSDGGLVLVLDAVGQVDSAGLALLIDWLAAARAAGRELRYEQLPPAVRALARLSDVEDLLAGA